MFDRIPVDVFLDTNPLHDDLRLHVNKHLLVDKNLLYSVVMTCPSSRPFAIAVRAVRTSRRCSERDG
jgi:hypothetical protein